LNKTNCLKFEIREYPTGIKEWIFIKFILFLPVFGILMFFIEDKEQDIGRYSVLAGVFSFVLWYLFKFFIQKPDISGCIEITNEYVNFKDQQIATEEIDYISINFKNFRGRFVPKRNEYPLPKFGINNEIHIRLKSGGSYSSNFFVKNKRDRKKIDPFIKLWIDGNIQTQYLVDDEILISNI